MVIDEDSNLSDRLRFALRILGTSQTDLARQINVKPQIIQYLCAAKSEKSKFTFDIAEALKIDVLWLATGKGVKPNLEILKKERSIPVFSFQQIRESKIYGKHIDQSQILKWLPINEETNIQAYAVILNDRSMAPRFCLDTTIIVEPKDETDKRYSQEYVLVYVKSEDFVIFRQIQFTDNSYKLIPTNNNLYKETILHEDDIILGICKEARWNT
jgi:transcriptional regulator with XRE-family HTH domain